MLKKDIATFLTHFDRKYNQVITKSIDKKSNLNSVFKSGVSGVEEG